MTRSLQAFDVCNLGFQNFVQVMDVEEATSTKILNMTDIR